MISTKAPFFFFFIKTTWLTFFLSFILTYPLPAFVLNLGSLLLLSFISATLSHNNQAPMVKWDI